MHVLSLHKVDLVGVVLTGLTAGYVMALVLVSGAKCLKPLEKGNYSKQAMYYSAEFTAAPCGTQAACLCWVRVRVARAMRRRLLAMTPSPSHRSIPSCP